MIQPQIDDKNNFIQVINAINCNSKSAALPSLLYPQHTDGNINSNEQSSPISSSQANASVFKQQVLITFFIQKLKSFSSIPISGS